MPCRVQAERLYYRKIELQEALGRLMDQARSHTFFAFHLVVFFLQKGG